MRDTQQLRYFLYARKSSESEDRQMASIEDQKTEVLKIAQELGLNIVGVFSESKSAKAPGRKAFNEMLLKIEKKEADGILCWKLNRLARNPVDGGKISWMLQNNIIQHIQCFGREYKPSDNVLMMQVELGMANQFVKDLSVDIQRGMRQKAERGWYPFPVLPVGYLHHKDRKGVVHNKEIIIDKQRYPLVKKLWKLMLTGDYSIADIKREGDRLGLVNDQNKPYVIHTYHKMFSTEFYCGYFYWKDSNGNKKRFKGRHKAMVSQQEFDRVQVFIGNKKRATRAKKYDYPFRGLLNCGECGCTITAERKFQVRCTHCRHKFSCINTSSCTKCSTAISEMDAPTIIDIIYYRCTKRKGKCSQKTVTEKELQAQYAAVLKDIEITPEFYAFMVEALQAEDEIENADELQVIGQLKKQKSILENRLNGMALMRADGDMDKEQYIELKQTTLDKITVVEKQIKASEKEVRKWYKVAQEYMNFALNARNVLQKTDHSVKRSLLLKLGSNQILMDRKLYFIKAKPLLAIKECYQAYSTKNGRFEPQHHLINKGDSMGFDASNASLCTAVQRVRTSIISQSNDQKNVA